EQGESQVARLPTISAAIQLKIMAQKTVLITGCSSGIGLALAVKMARDEQKRFTVYATMRNLTRQDKLAEAAGRTLGKTLEIKQLDVCSEESIKTCVSSIPDRRIDILVSNAGMGLIGPIECQTIDEMKTVMDTNFFGLVRLLKEILPDMKKRKSGHIVIISSVMGIQGILFNDVYAASKFAVEGFCESLAIQALKFKLQLSLIEPGPVITEFEKKVFEDGMKMDLSAADEETADMFTNIYLKNYKQIFQILGQSAEDIAEIILAENPPFRHQTNTLYTPMTTLKYVRKSKYLSLTYLAVLTAASRLPRLPHRLRLLLRPRWSMGIDVGINLSLYMWPEISTLCISYL
uniref:Retinol dehydrogenase 8 n=1 Tax=Gopherus evgoodei TaxID=1825980 RepID=A0A8C4Y8B4_9SAUR